MAKLVQSLSLTAEERERKERQENEMYMSMARKEMKRQSTIERSDTIRSRRGSLKVVWLQNNPGNSST